MGKKLIIKGADFAVNAITDIVYTATSLIQALVVTNSENANYGKIQTNIAYISGKLPVMLNSGKSVKYFLTNNGTVMKNVQSGYILSTSNVALANGSTIPVNSIVKNEKIFDGDNGIFTIENDTNSDAYLYFIFASDITVDGKVAYYAIVG